MSRHGSPFLKLSLGLLSIFTMALSSCTGVTNKSEPNNSTQSIIDSILSGESYTFSSDDKPKTYTVTFVSNGGSSVESQTIEEGQFVVNPEKPERSGYIFNAWCTDSSLLNAYNFATPVTSSFVLYARWDKIPNTYKVTFTISKTNYKHEVEVQEYQRVVRPEDPQLEGYEFLGWYTNSSYNEEFDFETLITRNTTIYGKVNKMHVHTFSTDWTSDNEAHWHAATCGHDEIADYGPHEFVTNTVKPTFESEGYTSHTCKVCGYSYVDKYKDKLEHTYGSNWSYDNNTHYHACLDAGYEDLHIDVTPHTFIDTNVERTYEHGGCVLHTCSVCGYSFKTAETEPLEHNYNPLYSHNERTHWRACIDSGYEYLKIAENPHEFDEEVIAPTFEQSGVTRHTCKVCGYYYDDNVVSPLEHNYSTEWSTNNEKHWKACLDNGYLFLTKDEANHAFTESVVAPTHTSEGYTRHQCTVCNYYYDDNFVDPIGHTFSPEWKNNETHHWHECIDEGFTDLKGSYSEHDYVKEVTDPTYEHPGYTTYRCVDCGYSYRDNYHGTLPHGFESGYHYDTNQHWHQCTDEGYSELKSEIADHTYIESVTVPTEFEGGYTTYTCSICGYSYRGNETNPTGHLYSTTWESNTTQHWHACIDEGFTDLKGSLGNHTYQDTVVPATFESKGYTIHKCSVCGYTYNDNYTDEVPHNYSDLWNIDEGTGEHYHICTDPGYADLRKDVGKHTYIDQVVPATFESEGYTIHTCSVCGSSYRDSYTDVLTHNYSSQLSYDANYHYHACTDEGYTNLKTGVEAHLLTTREVAPTFEEDGYIVHYCTVCGYTYITEGQPKLEHEYSNEWSYDENKHYHACTQEGCTSRIDEENHQWLCINHQPTYESQGYDEYQCIVCGYTYTKNYVPAKEHNYSDEWRYTNEVHYHECTDYNYTYLRKDQAEHTMVQGETIEPTFDSRGYTIYRCSVCGYEENRDYIPALEHNYSSEWGYDGQYHYHVCTDQGYGNLRTGVEAHNYEVVSSTPATYESAGTRQVRCTVCGYSTTIEGDPKLEHNFSDEYEHNATQHWHRCIDEGYGTLISEKEDHEFIHTYYAPTFENDGYDLYECSHCHYAYSEKNGDKLEHNYSDVWAYNDASHYHACIDAGYAELIKDQENHTFTDTVVDPTFERQGYTLHTCSVCGYSYKDNYTNALPHNFSDEWSYDDTYHWHACTDSGYEDLLTNRGVHSYGDWTVYRNPTMTEEGEERRTCHYCDHYESRSIDVLTEISDGILVFQYSEDNTYLIVVGYRVGRWDEHDVVIPSTFLDVPVKEIADRAFDSWLGMKSVVIPTSIEKIGSSAFASCNGLTSVTIPEGVKEIGDNIFYYCTKLESVSLPSTLETIPTRTFYGSDKLKTITLASGIKTIAERAFEGCYGLEEIVIPDSVTSIGSAAFKGCHDIVKMTLPFVGEAIKETYDATTLFGWIFGSQASGGDRQVNQYSGYATTVSYYVPSSLQEITITNQVDIPLGAFSNLSVTKITLGEKTRTIGHKAFYYCNYLTELNIPNAITTIGDSAFAHCNSVEGFTLPTSLTSIGSECFEYGPKFNEITIPTGITTIPMFAFAYNQNIKSVILHSGVTSIDVQAFIGNDNLFEVVNLSSLNITKGSTDNGYVAYYALVILTSTEDRGTTIEENGFVTYRYGSIGILLEYTGNATEIVIPDYVTDIKSGVFRNKGITSVVVPSGVKTISDYAFAYNDNLASVTLPTGLEVIGEDAFCYCPALTSIVIPSGVTTIKYSAFSQCTSLESVVLPDTLDTIEGSAFSGDTKLYVVVNESNLSLTIGATGNGRVAFYAKIILDSVDEFGELIDSEDFLLYRNTYGDYLIEYKGSEPILTVPNTVIKIIDKAFYQNENVVNITLPENLTSIGKNAFYGCTNLREINFPRKLTSIGERAFFDCPIQNIWWDAERLTNYGGSSSGSNPFNSLDTLRQVSFGNYVEYIPDYAFYGASLMNSVIWNENKITYIGNYAFYLCSSFLTIYAPCIQTIGSYAFAYCTTVDRFNSNEPGELVLGSTITSIGVNAFNNIGTITSLTIPFLGSSATDTYYGVNYVFTTDRNAGLPSSVTSLTILSGDIRSNLVTGNTNLTRVTIGGNATSVGDYAFSGCTNLASITLPTTINAIGTNAFYRCSSLIGFDIPAGVTSIGSSAFYGCESLTSITIPHLTGDLPYGLLDGCFGLTSITFNCENVGSLNDYSSPFGSSTNLETVVLGSNVRVIGSHAFDGLNKLSSINLTTSDVHTIGSYAFNGCTSLTNANLPNNLISIGSYAFNNCTGITSISVPSSVQLASGTFGNCVNVETLSLNLNISISDLFSSPISGTNMHSLNIDGAQRYYLEHLNRVTIYSTNLPDYAFIGCSSITEFTAVNVIRNIGKYAFYGCSGITEIPMDFAYTIGAHAFDGCTSLFTSGGDSMYFSSLQSIGEYAFKDVINLRLVGLECETLTTIGQRAFEGCTGLERISFPASLVTIDRAILWGCTSLQRIDFATLTKNVGYLFGWLEIEGLTYNVSQHVPQSSNSETYVPNTLRTITVASGDIPEGAFENMTSLLTITIPEDATSIGRFAFYNTRIRSITLPSTLVEIGAYSFMYASELESVDIPDGITTIPSNAFYNATNLSEVTLSDNLESISTYAFLGCTSLEILVLPASLTSIGYSAFQDCTRLMVIIDLTTQEADLNITRGATTNGYVAAYAFMVVKGLENLGTFVEENGLYIYRTNDNKDYVVEYRGTGGSVTIGENVVEIIPSAFEGSNITSITIGENVTAIGKDAFKDCAQLATVNWNATNAVLADAIFENNTALTTFNIGSNVTNLNNYTFKNISTVTSITIPAAISSIATNAFAGMTGLTSIIWNATNCEDISFPSTTLGSVTTLTIGSGVTSLPQSAFTNLAGLETVYWNATNFTAADSYSSPDIYRLQIFNNNSVTSIVFGTGITSVPKCVFMSLSRLDSIDFADVTTISEYAFANTGLHSLTLTSSIISVGNFAFKGCEQLTTLTVDAVDLGRYAFRACTSLETVSIGIHTTNIQDYCFTECTGLRTLNWNSNATRDANVFSATTGIQTVVFGADITSIPESICRGFTSLTTVTIPNNITRIENSAFYGCTSLTGSFTISRYIEFVGGAAFINTGITRVYWNAINATLRENMLTAFDGVPVERLTIGEDVQNIPAKLFIGNTSLTTIDLSSTLRVIGDEAFKGCTALRYINRPEAPLTLSLTDIGVSAFEGCTNLTSITIPDSVIRLGNNAFKSCWAVTSITFEAGALTTIGEGTFSYITRVTSVTVPGTVETIGRGAFSCMTSLQSITVPFAGTSSSATEASNDTYFAAIFGINTASYIPSGETYGGLVSVLYMGSPTVTYYLPASLTTVTISGGTLFNGVFSGLTNITTINLGSSISALPNNAFKDCTALSKINSETDGTVNLSPVSTIGVAAFSGVTEITTINFGSATSIGQSAFRDCTGLQTVVIPNTVSTIGSGAFSGCYNISSMTIPFIGSSRLQDTGPESVFGYIFGTAPYTDATSTRQVYKTGDTTTDYRDFYIPNRLTTITLNGGNLKRGAFMNMSYLYGINLYSGAITYAPDYVFSNCTSLTTMGVTSFSFNSIGKHAFENTNLHSFPFGNSIVTIGDNAFYNVPLITIKLCSTLVSIGDYAFYNCHPSEIIPVGNSYNNLTTIGALAFASATADDHLETFGIPSSLTTIRNRAFENNTALNITFSNENDVALTIESGAFNNCGITGVFEIPSRVTSIGYNAFANNKAITSLIINNGTVDSNAFYSCDHITTVTIGRYVTSLANNAFDGCTALATVNYNAECIDSGVSGVFSKPCITQINIGPYVTTLGSGLFKGADHITEIVIPSNVLYAGEGVLADCTSLETVTAPVLSTISNNSIAQRFGYLFGSNSYHNGSFTSEIEYQAISRFGANSNYEVSYIVPTSLKYININGGTLVNGYFSGFTTVEYINICNSSIANIPDYAFYACDSLEGINVDIGTHTYDLSHAISVGSYAFASCGDVQTVLFADGLTTIGDYAFLGAVAVVSFGRDGSGELFIPRTVTSIGQYAFTDNNSILSIVFDGADDPQRAELSIGNYAFKGLSDVTEITFPLTTTSIGVGALKGMNQLVTLSVPFVGNQPITSTSNIDRKHIGSLFGLGSNEYTNSTGFTTINLQTTGTPYIVYVPDTLRTVNVTGSYVIPQDAFACVSMVTTISIDHATGIGNAAFLGCSALTSMTIPSSVTYIGRAILEGCFALTSLEFPFLGDGQGNQQAFAYLFTYSFNVYFYPTQSWPTYPAYSTTGSYTAAWSYANTSGTVRYPNSLTTVTYTGNTLVNRSFSGLSSLTRINIPTTITTIPEYAFYGCSNLLGINSDNTLVLHEGVTSIGAHTFDSCTYAQTITIPSTVVSIGEGTFNMCANLRRVNYNAINVDFSAISENTSPFAGAYGIQSLYFGEGITQIPDYFMYNISALSTVNFPSTLLTIGAHAFDGCRISNLNLPDGVTTIRAYAFKSNRVATLSIPSSVVTIGDHAFENCDNLDRTVTLPNTLVTIGASIFSDCDNLYEVVNLTDINLTIQDLGSYPLLYVATSLENKGTFESDENGIYTYAFGTEKYIYRYNGLLTSYLIIPSDITGILWNVFKNRTDIVTLTLGASLANIHATSFSGCTAIQTVNWYCTNLVSLGSASLFSDSTALHTIYFGSGVVSIPDYAFNNCTHVTTVDFSGAEALEYIGDYALCNLNFSSITIPVNVTHIGNYAISTSRSSFELSFQAANCSEIGYGNFIGTISTFTVGGYVTDVHDFVKVGLDNPYNITTLVYEAINITSGTFAGYNFTNLVIQGGVNTLPSSMFAGCTSITSLTLPASLTTLSYGLFFGCTSLQTVTFAEGSQLVAIGQSTFEDCTSLSSITIPTGVNSIGECAFEGCTSLTSLTLPSNISVIPTRCFDGAGLTNITIPSNVQTIDSYAFIRCTSLNNVTIQNGVRVVGTGAFSECTSIQYVYIPSSVTHVYSGAFVSNQVVVYCQATENPNGNYYDRYNQFVFGITSAPDRARVGYYEYLLECEAQCYTAKIVYYFGLSSEILLPAAVTVGEQVYDVVEILPGAFRRINATSLVVSGQTHKVTCTSQPFKNATLTEVRATSNRAAESLKDLLYGVTRVDSVVFTADVTIIPDNCLEDRPIYAVTFNGNVYSIGVNAFKGTSISSITIPNTVSSIGSRAFQGCQSLTSITLPASVTQIESNTFILCNNLQTVSISGAVTAIGDHAFDGCSQLTSITFTNRTIDQYKAITRGNLWHQNTQLTVATCSDGSVDIDAVVSA